MERKRRSEPASPMERRADDPARTARHQRLRRQRVWVAIANYLMLSLFAFYLSSVGQIALPLWGISALFALVVAANAGFLLLIHTGINRRFNDPSLTQAQIAAGIFFQLVLFGFSRTIFAQDIAFVAFVLVLMFGGFQMNARKIAFHAVPAYVVFVVLMLWQHGLAGEPLTTVIPRAAIYGLLLGWFTFFVGYISNLRLNLSVRNRDLRGAMGRIEELAIRDQLTGAFNRRYIDEVLQYEIARAERTGAVFSICMLDVDYFKRINDTHGHLVGDEVLHKMVARINRGLRRLDQMGHHETIDTVGRFGGEEFLLILPVTQASGARICAERVRRAISDAPFETSAGPLTITASVGVAQYASSEKADVLITRADKALYRAKTEGRNRTEVNAPDAH